MVISLINNANASQKYHSSARTDHHKHHGVGRADSHAPIGVMGDHRHAKGGWMFSYRFMTMSMQDNQINNDNISPSEIVTQQENTFAGQPMQPPMLRVTPLNMDMKMHMMGSMYGLTDNITLMGMLNYVSNDMSLQTFKGGLGTESLGLFKTNTGGLGDTKISALIGINDELHFTIGLSLPTGEYHETGKILTPRGTQPTVRLPYPMQLGSGSWDPIAGLTWKRSFDNWSMGTQWLSTFRPFYNSDKYRLGNEHKATAWASLLVKNNVSVSLRVAYVDRGNIKGLDKRIKGPIQTADPKKQGRRLLELGIGVNFLGSDQFTGHRISGEILAPIYQNLDGPQLKTNWRATLGYQYAF